MDNAGDSIPVTIDKDNSDDAINLNQDSVEKETPQNAEGYNLKFHSSYITINSLF